MIHAASQPPVANDRLGAIRTLCRTLSGLTIADALDHLTCVDLALRGDVDLPPGDSRLAGMFALLEPWGPEWGCDILEWTHDLILEGHHVNAHSGRMVWMLEVRDALFQKAEPGPRFHGDDGEETVQPGSRFHGDDRGCGGRR